MKGYSRSVSISGAAQVNGSIDSSTVGFMYAPTTAAFGNPVQKYYQLITTSSIYLFI